MFFVKASYLRVVDADILSLLFSLFSLSDLFAMKILRRLQMLNTRYRRDFFCLEYRNVTICRKYFEVLKNMANFTRFYRGTIYSSEIGVKKINNFNPKQ